MNKPYRSTMIMAVFVCLTSAVGVTAQTEDPPWARTGRERVDLPALDTNDLLKAGFKEEKGEFIADLLFARAKVVLHFKEENLEQIPYSSPAYELHFTNAWAMVESVNGASIGRTNCIVRLWVSMNPMPRRSGPGPASRQMSPAIEPIIRVISSEYLAYVNSRVGDNGTNDALAVIELLSKARATLTLPPLPPPKDRQRAEAYRAVWALCLQMMQKSGEPAAQRLILDEWNKSLKVDDDAVVPQIRALDEKWDRRLMTDDFWNVLKQTKNPKTATAIGYVLYQHGIQDDLERMTKIEKATPGRGLSNAINWLKYRLSGDKTLPPPDAAAPKIE